MRWVVDGNPAPRPFLSSRWHRVPFILLFLFHAWLFHSQVVVETVLWDRLGQAHEEESHRGHCPKVVIEMRRWWLAAPGLMVVVVILAWGSWSALGAWRFRSELA